jgi:hypothetical protein
MGPLALLAAACGTPDDTEEPSTTGPTPGVAPGVEPGAAQGAAWVGKTYLLRTSAGSWTIPRGIGQDIGPYVPGFLIRVDSADGTDVGVTIGTVPPEAGMDVQNACTATQAVAAQSAMAPGISIGPIDFVTHLTNEEYAVNAHIRGLSFVNVLPGGTDGTLTATLDFREIVNLTLLINPPNPDSACTALLDARDAPCVACPHDGAPYCLTIVAEPVEATEFAGTMTDIPSATCPDMLRE